MIDSFGSGPEEIWRSSDPDLCRLLRGGRRSRRRMERIDAAEWRNGDVASSTGSGISIWRRPTRLQLRSAGVREDAIERSDDLYAMRRTRPGSRIEDRVRRPDDLRPSFRWSNERNDDRYQHWRSGLARCKRGWRSAAEAAGRDPADVTIVGVTKTVGRDAVDEAYRLGHARVR